MPTGTSRMLGNFTVEAGIGGGGMGEVLLGRQPTLDRPVVLKKLRRDLASTPEYVERFHREACTAAAVHHQNVVAVYDCFTYRGSYYIAQEYVDGVDLKTALDQSGSLPPRLAALILLEVARGVEAIHARGTIHRDIKPANILVGREGATKIADFGIALECNATPLTLPGHAIGSPLYMSPEQLQGERVDVRSDIFSMGVVLYEMLAGAPPYSAPEQEDAETLLSRMKRENYVPLGKAAPSSPRYLRRLVRSCLRAKPRRRPGSVRKLRVELERRLGRPTTADARDEIAAWLWELGLFQVREGETLIARAGHAVPAGWRTKMRWVSGGFIAAVVVAVLAIVLVQQRVILRELAQSIPQAPSELISALETAGAQLRNDVSNDEDAPGGAREKAAEAAADSVDMAARANENAPPLPARPEP
jgi:hypothetical protein